MTYQAKIDGEWFDVEDGTELPGVEGKPDSFGWLRFQKDGKFWIALPGMWRKKT